MTMKKLVDSWAIEHDEILETLRKHSPAQASNFVAMRWALNELAKIIDKNRELPDSIERESNLVRKYGK